MLIMMKILIRIKKLGREIILLRKKANFLESIT